MAQEATRTCYRCEAEGTTREHFPPKAFFPRGGGLQLQTVPSCPEHNNDKSRDDMYVLTQICMNAASGENLAKAIFMRSVVGTLKRSPAFRAALNEDAEWMEGGARRYKVDLGRFDSFFDGLCHAIFFERYGKRFDPRTHVMHHIYLSFQLDAPEERARIATARSMMSTFFQAFEDRIDYSEAAKIDEIVYANHIVDPVGERASITIAHSFYGCFEVVSLLTAKIPPVFVGRHSV
jgi:hypothetical protein